MGDIPAIQFLPLHAQTAAVDDVRRCQHFVTQGAAVTDVALNAKH